MVDDKQENLLAVKIILRNEKVELILVDSAHKGLEETLHHDFCLILLDVQMPEMNGFEMAAILHEEESTSHIPIIFLTAIDEDQEYELMGYDAGAVDVIFKPLKSNRIIQSKVQVFLRIYEQQQKIEKLKEVAEEASKSKAMFLANMSHEIRTPLNSILGFSELLKQTTLTEQQQSYLGHVNLSGDMLFDLISDILDFSKIEAGTIELENKPFDLRKVITDTIEVCDFRSLEKNLYLKFDYPEEYKSMFLGDETRIRQIFINLINNALKFTAKGGVTIVVRSIVEEGDSFNVTMAVQDTGIGIKEEDLATIFKSFEQADNTITRKYGGTGLGLSIANSFVCMMKGQFTVNSVWQEGTEMIFTILLKGASEVLQEETKEIDIAGMNLKILIVDDIRSNQILLRSILKKSKCQVMIASNGLEAVNILRKEKFDLCFMDLSMPVMDGYEATRKIRHELKLNMPVIALSADAAREDVKHAEDAGMDDYLQKPFRQLQLKEIIRKWAPES